MFSVYLDKENAGQTSLASRPTVQGLRTGPVGKNFQQSGKSSISIPRKALGDINQRLGSTAGKQQMSVKKTNDTPLKLPQPASKPPKCQPKEGTNIEIKIQECDKVKDKVLPPVEHIPVWEEKDDFNDIWPVKERPGTYIEALREWRPVSMCPIHDDSDSDSLPEDMLRDNTIEDHLLDSPIRPELLHSLDELGLSLPPPHELFPEEILHLSLNDSV